MYVFYSQRFTTAPGMKLLLKGSVQVNQSILLLNNNNSKLLGGHVDHMYEKWKLDKVGSIKQTQKTCFVDFQTPQRNFELNSQLSGINRTLLNIHVKYPSAGVIKPWLDWYSLFHSLWTCHK